MPQLRFHEAEDADARAVERWNKEVTRMRERFDNLPSVNEDEGLSEQALLRELLAEGPTSTRVRASSLDEAGRGAQTSFGALHHHLQVNPAVTTARPPHYFESISSLDDSQRASLDSLSEDEDDLDSPDDQGETAEDFENILKRLASIDQNARALLLSGEESNGDSSTEDESADEGRRGDAFISGKRMSAELDALLAKLSPEEATLGQVLRSSAASSSPAATGRRMRAMVGSLVLAVACAVLAIIVGLTR
jgi:hypothetical protein